MRPLVESLANYVQNPPPYNYNHSCGFNPVNKERAPLGGVRKMTYTAMCVNDPVPAAGQ